MAIHFRCSACGGEHVSRLIQMDKASFENPTNQFSNNSEPCPKMRTSVTYSKKDMFWRDDPPKS